MPCGLSSLYLLDKEALFTVLYRVTSDVNKNLNLSLASVTLVIIQQDTNHFVE